MCEGRTYIAYKPWGLQCVTREIAAHDENKVAVETWFWPPVIRSFKQLQ